MHCGEGSRGLSPYRFSDPDITDKSSLFWGCGFIEEIRLIEAGSPTHKTGRVHSKDVNPSKLFEYKGCGTSNASFVWIFELLWPLLLRWILLQIFLVDVESRRTGKDVEEGDRGWKVRPARRYWSTREVVSRSSLGQCRDCQSFKFRRWFDLEMKRRQLIVIKRMNSLKDRTGLQGEVVEDVRIQVSRLFIPQVLERAGDVVRIWHFGSQDPYPWRAVNQICQW